MSLPTFETLEVTDFGNGILEIAFNRPKVFNAFIPQSYDDWHAVQRWVNHEAEHVKVVVFTGRGKYYTSGQQLEPPDLSEAGLAELDRQQQVIKELVDELILCPKVMIAAVNGPAVGLGVTVLGLMDAVYSVPHATFLAPFMKLAFTAEACSTYTFPRILGPTIATEVLLMGRPFTAQELEKHGLIGRILPAEGFREAVLKIAGQIAQYSAESLQLTKNMMRMANKQTLLDANAQEMEILFQRMRSKDSVESIRNFLRETEKKRKKKTAKKVSSHHHHHEGQQQQQQLRSKL